MDKVYRCSHPNAGSKAAQWAKNHYENSDSEYLVTLNLKAKHLHIALKLYIKHINTG